MRTLETTAKAVRKAVAKARPGEPFASRRLLEANSRAAVQRELSRLAQAGIVERVAQGVFVKAEKSPYVSGSVPPELSKVVAAIAERTGTKVQMSGAEAAARLGFSTQLPMQPVFQTTGVSRVLKVGSRTVRLKHASHRKLALAGRPSGNALAALWYLGKNEVSSETFAKIHRKIGEPEFKALTQAKGAMPAWMQKALRAYESSAAASRG